LPDVDSPHSFLGRKVLPVSVTLEATAGHRGVLHSLLGLVLVCAALGFALRFWLPPGLVYGVLPAIAAGYLSHLLLDALNPGGVPLLWPLKKRFSLSLCRVGSLAERILSPPLLLLAGYVVIRGVVLQF
jgi:inner membrane protein